MRSASQTYNICFNRFSANTPASKRDSCAESELALTKRRSNCSETPQKHEGDPHINATTTAFTLLQYLPAKEPQTEHTSPLLGEITNSEHLVANCKQQTDRA